MHPILNIAVTAARRAGDIITRAAERADKRVVTQKHHNDFVTEIDQLAERDIIATIKRAYPSHSILAEESGKHRGDEFCWIIDPLDGTTNFIHGFPHFAVSIAVQVRGQLEHAVIYDPVRQELFTASRGAGAKLNDYRIRIGQRKTLSECLIGTGFPYRSNEHLANYLRSFATMMPRCTGMRRAGSAALDLAYVAAGRLDGFWELDLQPWDIAAGILLIKEAGGMVTDTQGGENYLSNGNIVAANTRIIKEMLAIIRPNA
jgi:myo-inositol-1(or 4)-monophosphatase